MAPAIDERGRATRIGHDLLTRRHRTSHIFAIDGGGSKTLARLLNADGSQLGDARGGPANLYQDRNQAARQINQLWDKLSGGIDPSDTIFTAGFAGLEAVGASAFLDQHLPAFRNRIIIGDAEAAFLAAFRDQPGCLLIVGTGVAAMRRREPAGDLQLLSGWGFPIHDQGAGAWFGAELIRHFLNHLDGVPVDAPALFGAVTSKLGQDRISILAWLEKARPADFASLVPAILSSREPLAEYLLEKAAGHLHDLALALDPAKDRPLRLAGGLAPIMQPKLQAKFGSDLVPDFEAIDPLDGLVHLAQNSIRY